MKRKKIGGDFRSNVSLGATAEKVELTPEQEEIALKVAKISGMPWCAVDIMPLVKGSNPEIGDNNQVDEVAQLFKNLLSWEDVLDIYDYFQRVRRGSGETVSYWKK